MEERFDNQFGKDGPDRNSDSVGRLAGCDDCHENILLRAEHKAFLFSEKAIWQKEQAEQLKSLLNKSKTERGLGIALANYIKNIKE